MQLFAHFLADFTFQKKRWCEKKNKHVFSLEQLYHIIILFCCSWLCSMQIKFWWAALIISLMHFIIDMIKSILYRRKKLSAYLFFIDQAFHLFFIVIITCLFSSIHTIKLPSEITLQHAFIALSFLLCTKPANILIGEILSTFEIPITDIADKNQLIDAGKLIGTLERIISLALILINQFTAIGFIIAAKSLLRFRDTATARTEYLLIGTLLSFGITVFLGITYRIFIC